MRKNTKIISMLLVAILVFSSVNFNVYASEPIEQGDVQTEEESVENVNELVGEQTVSEILDSSECEEEKSSSSSETEIIEETAIEDNSDIDEEIVSEIELLAANGTTASGTCGTYLTWSFSETTGQLTIDGTRTDKINDYYIESLHTGCVDYPAPPWYKYRDSIKSIFLNPWVSQIGEFAFADLPNLESVTFSNAGNVSVICDGAFYKCSSLKSVDWNHMAATTIESYAFYGCSSLANIVLSDDIECIGHGAFEGCSSVTTLTLNDNLKTVGNYTFSGMSALKTLNWGKSTAISFGAYAFSGCGISSVSIPENYTFDSYAFSGCRKLIEATLPKSMTMGPERMFNGCWNLQTIHLPETMTIICNGFCNGCKLKELTLPDGVEEIYSDAFGGCEFVTISIPSTITYLGDAFRGCGELRTVIFNSETAPSTAQFGSVFSDNPRESDTVTIKYPCTWSSTIKVGNGGDGKRRFKWEKIHTIEKYTGLEKLPGGVTGDEEYWWCPKCSTYYADEEGTQVIDCIFDWAIDESGVLRINGVGALPNYTSDAMAPWSIYKSQIKKVILQEGITSIGDYAFYNCDNLTEGSLPSTLANIGQYAFSKCAIESIDVPENVSSIGEHAFYNCKNLQSVDLPDKLTTISDWLFASCDSLKIVDFIPANVTTIGRYAFYGSEGIENVVIPDKVTTIDFEAFGICRNLKAIYIPKSVTQMNLAIYPGCDELKIVYYSGSEADWKKIGFVSGQDDNIPVDAAIIYDSANRLPWTQKAFYNVTFDSNGGSEVTDTKTVSAGSVYGTLPIPTLAGYDFDGWYTGKTSGVLVSENDILEILDDHTLYAHWVKEGEPFASGTIGTVSWSIDKERNIVYSGTGTINKPISEAYAKQVKTITVSEGITGLGYNCFKYMNKVTQISLPSTLTKIGERSFSDCKSLKSIDIPSNVTTIDKSAFYYCIGLESISLPNGLQTIGERAFESCKSLTSVNIPASVTSFGEQTFLHCTSMKNIYVDENNTILSSEDGVLFNKDKTILLKYPEGRSQSEYEINSCVQRIEDWAFWGAVNLVNVVVPDSVNELGVGVFCYCKSLESVVLPEKYTSLPVSLFNGCSNLKSFTIPKGVESIGENCFYSCSQLEKVIIPASVTEIASWRVFQNSPNVVLYCCSDYVENFAKTNSMNYIRTDKISCAVPVANVSQENPIKAGTKISLSTSTSDALIYYTLDDAIGLNVNPKNGILYSNSISITADTNIYAVAVNGYFKNSDVVKFSYTIKDEPPFKYTVADPVFSIETGAVLKKGSKLPLSTTTNGASIYYTLNGSEPNAKNGILYEDAIVIASPVTIKAIAVKEGYADSEIVSATYTIKDESADWGDVVAQDQVLYANANEIPESFWIAGVSDQNYTGNAITFPEMRVYYHKQLLKNGTDYTVKYASNIKAGNATVTITGKGNYSGTIVKTFKVNPLSLGDSETNNANLKALDITLAYTGKVQKGTTVVTYMINGTTVTLKSGTDFTYQYLTEYDYETVGDHYIIIKGKGNYCGTAKIKETIDSSKKLITKVKLNKMTNMNADGTALTPDVILIDGAYRLVKDTDYTLEWQNNVFPGTATVIITGINDYAGTRTTTFKINAIAISKAVVSGIVAQPYTGNKTSQSGYSLTYKASKNTMAETLVEGTDYTVSYASEINAGNKATIIFTGINRFSGTLKKTYTITPYVLSDGDVTPANIGTVSYQKNGATPVITVTANGKTLKNGTDYTLKYSNNKSKNDGTNLKSIPTVTITGKGNYKGTITRTFKIEGSSLEVTRMTATDIAYAQKTGICKPTITLYDTNNAKLAAGTDYDKTNIKYEYAKDVVVIHIDSKKNITTEEKVEGTSVDMKKDIIPVGTEIKVTVYGKGNYAGTEKSTIFRFVKADISKATIKVNAQGYTGYELTPSKDELTITIGSGKNAIKLAKTDYEIVGYSANINKGKALITIHGLGKYGGIKTISFTINPKSMNYTIIFDKNSSSATGTMKNASITEGKALTANAYKWSGHTFKGWSYTPDGEVVFNDKEKFVDPTGRYGRTITMYAIWD